MRGRSWAVRVTVVATGFFIAATAADASASPTRISRSGYAAMVNIGGADLRGDVVGVVVEDVFGVALQGAQIEDAAAL